MVSQSAFYIALRDRRNFSHSSIDTNAHILADESIPRRIRFRFLRRQHRGLGLGMALIIRIDWCATTPHRGSFLSGNPDASELGPGRTFAEENELDVGDSLAIVTPGWYGKA